MQALYPFFIAFLIIFFAELGDKTQLLVLSFASKSRVYNILIGIAIGSLFSHGIAIVFGSNLGVLQDKSVLYVLKLFTYIVFLIVGLIGFWPKKEKSAEYKSTFFKKLSYSSLNYVFIIAISIMIGEIGDKTFLASIGLGVEYPHYKLSLIAGCILGMTMSNSVAILFGKFLEKHFSDNFTKTLSNIIFILFGIMGILKNQL